MKILTNKFTIKVIFSLIFFLSAAVAFAGEYLGLGAHIGFHPDAGNLSQMNVQVNAQNSYMAGVIVKLDVDPFFIKTGGDFVFLSTNGGFSKNNTYGHTIKNISSKYTSIPLYAGLNFTIKERGKLYIGAGAAWILGYGEIELISDLSTGATKKTEIDEKIFGIGIICGVQMQVSNSAGIFMDWEYLTAKTDPIVDSSGLYTGESFKNFSLDYTGQRFHFGFIYYAI